eukprot:Nitzschia sp. Nitz4//scaffold168_size48592//11264//12373//NITZ4_007046-RA/size48592-augustus-gene-0.22-mRNA-1//-1//CDS//3329538309//7915//frame0
MMTDTATSPTATPSAPKQSSWKNLKLHEEAIGGLSAGMVGTVIGFPLDTIKTRMQTRSHGTSIAQVAKTVYREEGIRSFYKGMGPPLLSLSILGTLTFTQYSFFQDFYGAQPGVDWRNFVAGISCSPVAGMISTVENLVKTQMQLDNVTKKEFNSSLTCFRTLIERHGWGIVYTGHAVNTLREATFLGNYFFVYEVLRAALTSEQDTTSATSLDPASASSSSTMLPSVLSGPLPPSVAVPLAGGCAGAIAWLASFPLDCVRAGTQGQILPPTQSSWSIAVALVKERGIGGLYAGATASVIRAFLVSGTRFSAYEFALWVVRGGRHFDGHNSLIE